MSNKFRVIIVEDEPRILDFLVKKIQQLDSRFEVIATARNGMDALSLAEELEPHVLFSDVQMPIMSGLELVSNLSKTCPNIKTVIVSGYRDFDYVREALRYEVVDYLLKPILDYELSKLLKYLASELECTVKDLEAEAVSRAAANRLDPSKPPVISSERSFYVLLICIGNLMNNASQISHSRIFINVWKKIDFGSILSKCGITAGDWWVCDGWSINHKCLVLDSHAAVINDQTLHTFLELLVPQANGYPVNICTMTQPMPLTQLHQGILQLKKSVAKSLVTGQSHILPLLKGKGETSIPSLLTHNQIQLLKSLITACRYDDIKKQLSVLLQEWEKRQFPQIVLENGLRQLLRLFCSFQSEFDEMELCLAEYNIFAELSTARSFKEIFPDIHKAAKHLLTRDKANRNFSLKTADDIEKYIRGHFTEDISLESIAEIMGFHTVYINRVFKKEKQITPIQYLINLRIDRAKELIIEYPDWDFCMIGESVGYHDPHYFSRAFKKATGISPSEYRSSF